jgi:hypothetical protein
MLSAAGGIEAKEGMMAKRTIKWPNGYFGVLDTLTTTNVTGRLILPLVAI